MTSKLQDAQESHRKALKEKECLKKELDLLYGVNSRRCRNVFKKIRKEMKQLRSNMRTKNAAKVTWLLSKYRQEEEDTKNIFTVPGDIEDYKDAKIFDSGFETPEVVTDYKPPEIVQLGDISPPLDEDELSVLQLPTKTSVNGKLKLEDFDF